MKNQASSGQWPGGKPPAIVHEYVEWLVTPEHVRTPRTRAEWAREHNLDHTTVYGWDKDDRVKWLISDKADKLNMSPDRIQAVMNAMWKKAEGGDVQAAKLYMDHVDKLMPRKPTADRGFEDLSDEELAELAREVLSDDLAD